MINERRKMRVKKEFMDEIKGYDKTPGNEASNRHYGEYADNREGFKAENHRDNLRTGEKMWTPDEGVEGEKNYEFHNHELEPVGDVETEPEKEHRFFNQ